MRNVFRDRQVQVLSYDVDLLLKKDEEDAFVDMGLRLGRRAALAVQHQVQDRHALHPPGDDLVDHGVRPAGEGAEEDQPVRVLLAEEDTPQDLPVELPLAGNCAFRYIVEEALGARYVMPPALTRRTMELGAKYSPDFVCTPFKTILGSITACPP